jgi:hypothetical protein
MNSFRGGPKRLQKEIEGTYFHRESADVRLCVLAAPIRSRSSPSHARSRQGNVALDVPPPTRGKEAWIKENLLGGKKAVDAASGIRDNPSCPPPPETEQERELYHRSHVHDDGQVEGARAAAISGLPVRTSAIIGAVQEREKDQG